MSQTVIRGTQILNNTVQRQDLDTSTVGQAVVTKLVQGSGITLSSTGADSGTGDVTVTSPDVVSTDAGNIATLGTDNHILVPQSQIWSVRLRSFNAIGNPTFEVDQRTAGTGLATGLCLDRWSLNKTGTMSLFGVQAAQPSSVTIPGTNFYISSKVLQVQLATQQTTLGANDFICLEQTVEGPQLRELLSDVNSISLLFFTSVAGLKFTVYLQDPTGTRSLVKLVTFSGGWQLVTLPNLPIWPSAGSFSVVPGQAGYKFGICLACGSSLLAPAVDSWQNGKFFGAAAMDNFASKAVNSTTAFNFIQHEPGPLCTTPIDCPFTQAYDDALRYFAKSYEYAIKPGSVSNNGTKASVVLGAFGGSVGGPNFPKQLAITAPTITIYNHATGAANSFQDGAGVNHAVSSLRFPSGNGYAGINFSPATTGAMEAWHHYTADTGW